VIKIIKAGIVTVAPLVVLGLFPALTWSQAPIAGQFSSPASLPPGASLSGASSEAPASEPAAAEAPAASGNAAPAEPDPAYVKKKKEEPVEGEQTKRMMWVVPNFAAVSADTEVERLNARGKFVLAFHDSMDYSGFTWTAIIAGQAMATRSDPELGHGMAGYGRYYWRAFADGVSGTFFTEAIVPAITHEDPRYYTKGHGGFFRRMGYALSRTVVTRTDSGGLTFNAAEVVGNLAEAGLSNAYYPPEERGLKQTGRDWGMQMESAAVNNIAKEFWPDIRNKFFRRKQQEQ
jgi:hypothetical protein